MTLAGLETNQKFKHWDNRITLQNVLRYTLRYEKGLR